MCIHMSSFAKAALDSFPGYVTECRGDIEVKGKGLMTTYFLFGSQDNHLLINNNNETLQETVDPITKMTPYKMNRELMQLLSLKDTENVVSEISVRTRDVDLVQEISGANDRQFFASPHLTNKQRHPKNSSDTRCNNSVTFGGCSLIINQNCQRNSENSLNVADETFGKKEKPNLLTSETPIISSILKNGSQQLKTKESKIDERKKYQTTDTDQNTESTMFKINGGDSSVCTTYICANLVSDQVYKNNSKNRVPQVFKKLQEFEELEREHSYVKKVESKLPSPQQRQTFPQNCNVYCFQGQKAEQISTNICQSQNSTSNNKMIHPKNQIFSVDKNELNNDVYGNYANNLKNFNNFTNSLMASSSSSSSSSSHQKLDSSLAKKLDSSLAEKLDSSPAKKVDFASIATCISSASTKDPSNSPFLSPITNKNGEKSDGIVVLTNAKTGQISLSDDGNPGVTYQSHIPYGTDKHSSVIINMRNINDEMTSLWLKIWNKMNLKSVIRMKNGVKQYDYEDESKVLQYFGSMQGTIWQPRMLLSRSWQW